MGEIKLTRENRLKARNTLLYDNDELNFKEFLKNESNNQNTGKIYCIIGKSGSGKSTIEKELENLGIIRLISTTTRPRRENEKEGIDYYFVIDNEFEQLKKDNQLLENSTYGHNWHYGIDSKHNTIDLKNHNYVCVIEPNGYHQLLQSVGKENIYSFYIKTTTDKERLLRCLERETDPNCTEICERYLRDLSLFDGIENEVDEIITNEDLRKSVIHIYEKIIGKKINNFTVGNIVKVTDVINKDKVPDLLKFIGQKGIVLSWKHSGVIKKYRVIFDIDKPSKNDKFGDFNGEELELVHE